MKRKLKAILKAPPPVPTEHNGLPLRIKRQKRRSMMLRRVHDTIEVYIPRWMSHNNRDLRAFVAEGLQKLDELPPPPERIEITAPNKLRLMVIDWAERMNVEPGRITLRAMTRKWGSCSSGQHVTLNTALCYIPQHLAEYVVVHELTHLRVLNHGPDFYALLAQYLPDWEAREKELNQLRVF